MSDNQNSINLKRIQSYDIDVDHNELLRQSLANQALYGMRRRVTVDEVGRTKVIEADVWPMCLVA